MKDTVIEVAGVSYAYPGSQEVLTGLSLKLGRGERIALIGANGAGKSTLFTLISGLITPSSGQITIDGELLSAKSKKKARQKVGVVFQNPDEQLFCTTVYEDVAFGPRHMNLSPSEVGHRVNEALELMEITPLAQRPPYRLSDGEKRKASIASVLSMAPEALLLDEPTATLDPRARRVLSQVLSKLPQAMLIATHDLDFARSLCPSTAILYGGKIEALGPTPAILADQALLERCGL